MQVIADTIRAGILLQIDTIEIVSTGTRDTICFSAESNQLFNR